MRRVIFSTVLLASSLAWIGCGSSDAGAGGSGGAGAAGGSGAQQPH